MHICLQSVLTAVILLTYLDDDVLINNVKICSGVKKISLHASGNFWYTGFLKSRRKREILWTWVNNYIAYYSLPYFIFFLSARCLFPPQVGLFTYTKHKHRHWHHGREKAPWPLWGEQNFLSVLGLVAWDGGGEWLLSPALTGDRGGAKQIPPLPPLARRSHVGDMFSSKHYSKWKTHWPGSNHYRVRCKW